MIPTADPNIWIEAIRPGYVRYTAGDGRRWEVLGVCDRRGDCLIGSVIDGQIVRDHEHLAEVAANKPGRVDSELDVPVTPDLNTCCGADLLTFKELT